MQPILVGRLVALCLVTGAVAGRAEPAGDSGWRLHVVHAGVRTHTAVAGDFTGDGRADVIANSGRRTRLFVGPDWREVVLEAEHGVDAIHSACLDVDGDGDLDYVGAQYQPGLIFWLEQPERPLEDPWSYRVVTTSLNGIHGLLAGDVDGDGRPDLLANSAQPVDTPFPESLAWLRAPGPDDGGRWRVSVFADRDAPGLTHYFGFGDVNGDGRPDAAVGAKGAPSDRGDWFAWWEAPADPAAVWERRLIAAGQKGATNIAVADVNGDGRADFLATRGHGSGVLWFEGPDWTPHLIHEAIREPHCLVVADLDADGDPDAATCAFGSREAWWYENDGAGRFKARRVATDQAAYDIRAHDMDGDGDLDLLIAGQASDNVVWCENPARGAGAGAK